MRIEVNVRGQLSKSTFEVKKEPGERSYSTGFGGLVLNRAYSTQTVAYYIGLDAVASIFPAVINNSACARGWEIGSRGRTGSERRILREVRRARPMAWSMSKYRYSPSLPQIITRSRAEARERYAL